MSTTPVLSVRLSADGRAMLDAIAEYHGVSRTAALEMLIRKEARARRLTKEAK